MTNFFTIIPFLATAILLINPVLLFFYQRWEINTQKLRFWFMATTTVSWILLLLVSLLSLEKEITLGWISESQLLAEPVLIFDWISVALALALGGLALYSTVCQIFSPQQSAWITGLGGICILGTLAGSVFSILFIWTLVEVFWITYSVLYQSRDRGLILPVLFRLLVPLILIYSLGIGRGEGIGDSFSTYTAAGGPILIAAGGLGFGAWIPFRRRESKGDPGGNAEFLARIFPAGISLMLICRGALLLDVSDLEPAIPVVVAVFTLMLGLIGFITRSKVISHRIWSLGILGLIIGNALTGAPSGSLGWGLVFILAVSSIFLTIKDQFRSIPALIIAAIGILPIPYFPAWTGVSLFSAGITGVLHGIGAGLILGSILWEAIKRATKAFQMDEPIPLLYRLSPVIMLVTQVIITIPLLLVNPGKGIFSLLITVWIPIPLIILSVVFRDKVINSGLIQVEGEASKSLDLIPGVFSNLGEIGNRIVSFLSDIFEGEGGLIWALLIGFLLITLITLGGGS